jgi:hypothetical protein
VKTTYDPDKLISQVRQLLADAGVEPDLNQEGYGHVTALCGAGMLLRGLGAFPAADPADHYRRDGSGSWEEADDRAAAAYAQRASDARG